MNNLNFKHIILVVGTMMYFLNLTIYLPYSGIFPFTAYLLDISIFAIILMYYIKHKISLPYGNIFFIWILYYIVLNTMYFMFSDAGSEEFKYFKLIIFFLFVLISQVMLFNLDNDNLTITRKTLVYLAPIASFTLGVDYFDPGYFLSGQDLEYYVAGRAASLYLNANTAGGAMVLFLIFGIDMVPKKYRILYIVIVFLGVFFTMSRSNIMIMMLTLIIMFFQKKISTSNILFTFVGIMFFFTWLATGGLDTLSNKFDLKVTENMKNRVNFFADDKHTDTSDMDERKYIVKVALNMYMDKPILGNGFASTRTWHYRVSPHNTFAMNWADFGIFGLIIIPLMFYMASYYIFKYGRKEHKQLALLVIIYFSLSAAVSHNMLEQPLQLASIIALSAMGYKAKKKTSEAIQ